MFCRAGIQYFLIYSNVVWTLLTLTLTGSQKGVTRWKVKKRRGGSHRPRGFSSHGVRCEHVWISSPVTLDSCCFCEVLFSMLNTVTLFCMCLCFCKNHIYFTIFVDKKKNYLILIVFFYLNAIIIQFISPPPPTPPPVLIMSKSSVQRQRIMSLVNTSKVFDIQLNWFLFSYTFHLKEGIMKVLLYSWKTLEILPCRIEAAAACPRRCSETWI